MKFTIEIELGNDAMQTPYNVAAALLAVAADLRHNGFVGEGEHARIPDVNGNVVGKWEIQP